MSSSSSSLLTKRIGVRGADEDDPKGASKPNKPTKVHPSKQLPVEAKKEIEEPPIRPLRKVIRKTAKKVSVSEELLAEEILPKRGRPFGFRKLGGRKSKQSIDVDGEDVAEDDPVISLFAARATQRVRFSLEGTEPKEKKASTDGNGGLEKISPTAGTNIKKFMKGALFGSSKVGKEGRLEDEFEREAAREIEKAKKELEMVWESAERTPDGSEVVQVRTKSQQRKLGASELTVSFTENAQTRANVIKLLNKARRAQYVHYRYEYAVKCYVKALDLLTTAKYPDDHPTVVKTLESLNNAHHSLTSYKNSANIVKMGIKYEDSRELVRALKMYTIAYRIRRDNLSRTHPSLVVLLNMLGSIQIKREELEEAMQIYELALKDLPVVHESDDVLQDEIQPLTGNLLARGVTYRDMGTIHESWGETDEALQMYRRSLHCVAQYKTLSNPQANADQILNGSLTEESILLDLEHVRLSKAFAQNSDGPNHGSGMDGENGEMELVIGSKKKGGRATQADNKFDSSYDAFFPRSLEADKKKKIKGKKQKSPTQDEKQGSYEDVDLALTLHQIAQLHRAKGEYNLALEAFNVSLRGMRYALGKHHPNVAAVLGNLGNLQKEMGDMDAAFLTYQQVLGIESYRLGLSHPDVAITLHNIATIDAARGNHDNALVLYQQVVSLQRKLFGPDDMSVAVTSACMGDVYERVGDLKTSTECFEEALRIKSETLGRHSLEVARLLHKLGKLSRVKCDFHLADSYISRAVLIYRLNKLADEDEWVVDAYRDSADIDAEIAMGRGDKIVC
jgi:tetratricopeptide (TPR) repeat protein